MLKKLLLICLFLPSLCWGQKTLFFRGPGNGIPVTGNWTTSETIGPATENTATNHTGNGTANTFIILKPGAVQGATTVTSADTTAPPISGNQFGWFSDASYNGTFAAGTWIFQHEHDDNRSAQTGLVVVNVYKSTTQNFSGTWTFLFQIVTNQDWWTGATGTASFTTPSESAVTMNNEFLFFQVWCNETVTSTNRSHNFHVDGNVTANVSKMTTTTFTPAAGVACSNYISLLGAGCK